FLAVLVTTFVSRPAFADDAPTTTAPASISMHMQSIHPKEVLAELCTQTGVAIQVWPENRYAENSGMGNRLPVSIDADFDQQSFWSAMEKICTAANLRPWNMGNNN